MDPKSFAEPPASPVVVTKEPTYGDLNTNNDGTFTYTPPAITPAQPVVDVVEFRYTNLSGEAVVIRKEFVITYKGDVPSIIQTGGNDFPISNYFGLALILLLVVCLAFTRLDGLKKGQNNA